MNGASQPRATWTRESEIESRGWNHNRIHVSYELRLSDLYWVWQTSAVGLTASIIFVVLGLALLSAPLLPGDYPVGTDIEYGLLSLALAPLLAPAVLMIVTGGLGMRGRTVKLALDEAGLDGWPVPYFRETTWARLRHPRLESRVLVLPFSWPFADAWAVVPARAFTPAQFAHLMAILEGRGFFRDGDRRSLLGKLVSPLFDRSPLTHSEWNDRTLARFPTFGERRGTVPFGQAASLRRLDGRAIARRLLVLGGFASLALAVLTDPPPALQTSNDQPTTFLASAGFAMICLACAWYAGRSRRPPRLVRLAAVAALTAVAAVSALVAAVSLLVRPT